MHQTSQRRRDPKSQRHIQGDLTTQGIRLHHRRQNQRRTPSHGPTRQLPAHPDLQKKTAEELLQNLDSLPADIRTTVRNNAGGHVNHSHLWITLKNPGEKPSGKLAKEIDQTFGSYDKWKEEMTKTAMGVFGSGWAWFARGKDGKLFIKPYPNQDSPVMEGASLIYGIDVWEHAYYLKYRNLRADYVQACLTCAGLTQ